MRIKAVLESCRSCPYLPNRICITKRIHNLGCLRKGVSCVIRGNIVDNLVKKQGVFSNVVGLGIPNQVPRRSFYEMFLSMLQSMLVQQNIELIRVFPYDYLASYLD